MAKATIKYLGARKFPAQQYDLDSISDNDRAGRDASSTMPYIRTSALFLRDSDEELEAKVRACGDDAERLDEWMNLLEGIGDALGAKMSKCSKPASTDCLAREASEGWWARQGSNL